MIKLTLADGHISIFRATSVNSAVRISGIEALSSSALGARHESGASREPLKIKASCVYSGGRRAAP
jgi:hypothetical protein